MKMIPIPQHIHAAGTISMKRITMKRETMTAKTTTMTMNRIMDPVLSARAMIMEKKIMTSMRRITKIQMTVTGRAAVVLAGAATVTVASLLWIHVNNGG